MGKPIIISLDQTAATCGRKQQTQEDEVYYHEIEVH